MHLNIEIRQTTVCKFFEQRSQRGNNNGIQAPLLSK